MDADRFSFRRARPDDEEILTGWFRAPHVAEFWGEAATNIDEFRDAMSDRDDPFTYWIGLEGDVCFSLLLTSDAAAGKPRHLAPFLPESGDAWTLDVLIGPLEYVGRGVAADLLGGFLRHAKRLNRDLQMMFIDPEANNARAIHVYEKAGFKSVSTFEPTDGAFKGLPHVLMAFHYSGKDADQIN